jgi:CheY-like chemotaxis protein
LRYRSLLFLLLMSLLLTVSCGTKPVAVVNGEKVSQERFERYFTQVKTYAEQMGMSFEGEEGEKQLANLKQDALDNLIDEILIMQTGGKEGIKVSENEINDFLEQRVKNAFENKEEQEIHLIIMDIMMPKMDGLKATIKLREEKNIPVILLSAKSEDTDKIIGLNMGASEVNQLPRIKLMIATAFENLHKDEQLDLQVCEDIGCKKLKALTVS